MTLLTGLPGPLAVPGSDEWLSTMSASKIAAVVGLSPWDSPFSLWHRMAGLIPSTVETDEHRRGHYLEPALAAWFADQHPEGAVIPAGTWTHPERPWQTASPDRLFIPWNDDDEGNPTTLVELKTSASSKDGWGTPGTDEIPPGYRCQAMWQMDTTGARVVHFAVLTAYLVFTEYVVTYDEDDAAFLRDTARAFLDSLPGGPAERRPDLDSHDATYQAVRTMHPAIEDRDVEIPGDLTDRYAAAVTAAHAADVELRAAKTQLLDAMGTARRATHLDTTIATRRPAGRGAVALHPVRSNP